MSEELAFVRRGGLLVPAGAQPVAVSAQVDAGAGRPDGPGEEIPVDGETERVRQLRAQAAEAARLRELPTARVLQRQAELAEAEALQELETAAHARQLAAQGERERATLAAQAASAAARRQLEDDPNVRALQLTRRRRRWTAIAWTVLVLALAFTTVNVQRFAAAGAEPWTPHWLVAWGVDPLLSALVIGLLLARGDLAAFGTPMSRMGRSTRLVYAVELGLLLATLGMNVAPELTRPEGVKPALVALHVIVPLAAMAAALMLPLIQGYYATAIERVYARATGGAAATAHPAHTPDEQRGLSERARAALAVVSEGIAAGELAERPSVNQIARYVRDRLGSCSVPTAQQVAAHLQGLHLVRAEDGEVA